MEGAKDNSSRRHSPDLDGSDTAFCTRSEEDARHSSVPEDPRRPAAGEELAGLPLRFSEVEPTGPNSPLSPRRPELVHAPRATSQFRPASCSDRKPRSLFAFLPFTASLLPADGSFEKLGAISTLAVTGRWREALLANSHDLPPSVRSLISGHDSGGSPLDEPHLAFFPLQHCGKLLSAMAFAAPRVLPPTDLQVLLELFARLRVLHLGPLGVWQIALCDEPPGPSLAGPATHWASLTPVSYDRHPKSRRAPAYRKEVADMIACACERIGLPAPREVLVSRTSLHSGVPEAGDFPPLRRKDSSPRRHAHAVLVFDRPVAGPVLLGAGRYRGYGAFAPLDEVPDGAPLRT